MSVEEKSTCKLIVGTEQIELETGFNKFSMAGYISNNEYEPWIIKYAQIILSDTTDPVIFDIGANIGLISLPLSRIFKKGKIHAFEALPPCAVVLENNIKKNNINNIRVINKAISSSKDNLEINLPAGHALGNAFITQPSNDKSKSLGVFSVEAITVDDYVNTNHIKKIDLIKIDVEGWEEQVLIGAEKTIKMLNPTCIIEFNVTEFNKESENRAYSLWQKIQSLFNKIYLIDRLFKNLYEVKSFSDLRSLMFTSHNVEDLLCLNNLEINAKLKKNIVPEHFSCYGSAVTIRQDDGIISLLSYYRDGWINGRHASIISGLDRDVDLELECFWYPLTEEKENKILLYSSSGILNWSITDKVKKYNLNLPAKSSIYIWCSLSQMASQVFNNQDPRDIGFNMKILGIHKVI